MTRGEGPNHSPPSRPRRLRLRYVFGLYRTRAEVSGVSTERFLYTYLHLIGGIYFTRYLNVSSTTSKEKRSSNFIPWNTVFCDPTRKRQVHTSSPLLGQESPDAHHSQVQVHVFW